VALECKPQKVLESVVGLLRLDAMSQPRFAALACLEMPSNDPAAVFRDHGR
jgi:hypothetical protein